MSFLKSLFRGSGTKEASQPEELEARDNKMMLMVNTDNLSKETQRAVWEEIGKKTNLPLFEGTIEHGYPRAAVSQTDQCPRCHNKTQQHYANFIYATDVAPRVMFAPAGFFCTECPTVIIDEEMIEAGVKKGYSFQGVVGIDYEGKKDPDLFRTWNGKKPVYVFDENKNVMGLSTIDSEEAYKGMPQIPPRDKKKLKRKRQMAKQARRPIEEDKDRSYGQRQNAVQSA